jgi:methionyl-tRNA synthetase
MSKTFYITTPIYYVNDIPHIGHAYTTIAADVLARYKRLMGYEVFFLTGTEEHGQKIEKAAQQNKESPQELSDRVVQRFKQLWQDLNISNDDFIRTTEKRHYEAVHTLFKKVQEQGDIYKGEYEDWYCVPCETFLTDLQLLEDRCPTCCRPVEKLREESYFFKMSIYQDRLLAHLKKNPDFIQPVSRYNEILSFVEGGLKDLSVSRTGFEWGIPVPFDQHHVIYVWFDALTNYLTAIGYPKKQGWKKFWPADVHLVGKDILRFHTVYWPIFLMSAGLPIPKKIFAHGWWTVNGEKMSKSKGNVVDPVEVIREFGTDAFRYFVLREVPFGLDGDYSKEAMVNRFNNDLANDLGNLLSRTLTMIQQYANGKIPKPQRKGGILKEIASGLPQKVESALSELAFHRALTDIWQLVEQTNKYIEESAPWKLAKDPGQQDQLGTVLYTTAEALRILSLFLYPFIPQTCENIARQLGIRPNRLFTPEGLKREYRWGLLKTGTSISKGQALFPRIEKEDRKVQRKEGGKGLSAKEQIGIEDFSRIDLRVGTILSAQPIPGSEKLFKLKVDIGTEQRQIVAGIATKYTAESLINQKVIVLTNLKPARLMGVESQGMVLAAGDKEVVALATFLEAVDPGTPIR